MKALEELYRILQPGGKMLVYVWAFEQDERKVCYLILLQYLQLHSQTYHEQTLLVDGGREMKRWNNKNIWEYLSIIMIFSLTNRMIFKYINQIYISVTKFWMHLQVLIST